MSGTGPIEEIRSDYLTRYGTPVEERIEWGRVRDFLLAMDEPANLDPRATVPPLFLLTLGRTRRPQPSRGTAVNAGDEFEFLGPVRIGDLITTRRRVVTVEEKQGSRGRMYLTRAEATYVNQRGEKVAVARQSTLRWGW
jgi:hypothetical protein